MTKTRMISKYLLALFMVGAGTMHFIKPDFYQRIMPPYLPLHQELVYLSGFCEIALGLLLLVPRFSRFGAWGIVALLIAVFPANVYAANKYVGGLHMPSVPVRLAMQVVYILLLLMAGWGVPGRTGESLD